MNRQVTIVCLTLLVWVIQKATGEQGLDTPCSGLDTPGWFGTLSTN
ncbi:MAG: hypothetical protein L0387_33730 [Acidobacteria bacterium]|nr:hypothetical protein [Acidobacteriota bacterium]MCI0626558.1 hypothetical protein [Acidobacteriota bacterium]MCI0721636.1 hypothetical protein [Acidobacteriota bacterium]